ncbi:MAG: hypothetical protein RR232_03535 [Clostridia bacterium]
MVSLSFIHVLYLILIIVFLVIMACKKSIVIPCALGILIMGFVMTRSVIGALQALFNALVWAGSEFWGIIAVISLVVAMSKALSAIGADALMIKPFSRYMVNRSITFLLLGLIMFAVSICIWPSPAVALVGALMLPLAIESGVPVIWAAVAMNIFGHGMALSGDFFIQGAPTITAKAADTSVSALMGQSVLLWGIMSAVTLIVAFILFRADMRKLPSHKKSAPVAVLDGVKPRKSAVFVAILTPLVFVADIAMMLLLKLQGGDATALVGGSALVLLIIAACMDGGISRALDNSGEYIKDGFSFGIQIFAPVIVIAGFFFLGGEDAARAVFGEGATGILSDVGKYLAQNIPLSKIPIVISEAAVAVVTGLDGSGFSGLPLVGVTASTFAHVLPINKELLASMGQIITIWVDGGTIVPWAVIPVAAICGVNPMELVRKNLIPVLSGIAAIIIVTCILL